MEHAAAVHGVPAPIEQLRLGRIALNRLGLVSKSAERDRRPTQAELDLIIATVDGNPRQIIPLIPPQSTRDLRHLRAMPGAKKGSG